MVGYDRLAGKLVSHWLMTLRGRKPNGRSPSFFIGQESKLPCSDAKRCRANFPANHEAEWQVMTCPLASWLPTLSWDAGISTRYQQVLKKSELLLDNEKLYWCIPCSSSSFKPRKRSLSVVMCLGITFHYFPTKQIPNFQTPNMTDYKKQEQWGACNQQPPLRTLFWFDWFLWAVQCYHRKKKKRNKKI